MNSDFNSNDTMYKVIAFAISVILIMLIILIYISSSKTNSGAQTDTTKSNASEPQTDSSSAEAQSTAVDTTAEVTTADNTTITEAVTSAVETVQTTPADTQKDEPVEIPSGNTPEEIAEYLALYPDTVLGVSDDAGQEYIDKIIFLGDSTTYGLRYYAKLNGGKDTIQVWTPVSGTLTLSQASFAKILYPETDEEITIKEAVAAKKPEYIVITLGVNGVSFMGEEYFKSEYKKLIESVQDTSPDTKIICQSIFPVARTYESLKSINNQKIDDANRWICEIADECGVKYIDTNSVLRDEEGWLPETYHNGDGMHLNSDSFTLELNNIRTHAWPDGE